MSLMKAQVREDYIHDRAVIIVPKRGKRPHDVSREPSPPVVHRRDCPFCEGKLNRIRGLHTLKYKNKVLIKTIANIFPVVSQDNPRAYGRQEVIVETPEHDVELADLPAWHIEKLLQVYQQRTATLSKSKRINYIMIFKNNGGKAGQSLTHAHSQVFASEFVPPHIVQKLTRIQEHYIKHGRSYYQDLIKGEHGGQRMITEDKHMIVFAPYASTYNYEAWILPKRNIDNISLLNASELASMAKMLKGLLTKVDEMELPYNFYLHQVPHYPDEHLYLRIAPRRDIWAGLELGSRLIVNTVAPEDAAKFYRKAFQ